MNYYNENTRQKETIDGFSGSEHQDLSRISRRFTDKWYVFASGVIVALLIAVVINKFTRPEYKSNTTLLVRSSKNKPIGAEALIRDISFDLPGNIRNEIGVLKSYTLARRTLESLDLNISYHEIPRWMGRWRLNALSRQMYNDAPIVVTPLSSSQQVTNTPFYIRILSSKNYLLHFETIINNKTVSETDTFRFGQSIQSPYFNFIINLREKYDPELANPSSPLYKQDYSFVFHDTGKLASRYSKALEVDFYFDDASILELSLQGPHPGIATNYLNQHVQTFIESGLEEKNRMANATIAFIDRQISGISDSLQAAESDFQQFRSRNKLINISSEGNYAMEKLETLVTEKSNLQRMSKYYEYLFDYIQNQKEFNDIIVPSTMGISDQSLNNLVARLSEAYSARSRLLMTARENSPQVQQITKEIESIRQSLQENVRNIINTSNIEIEEINKQIEEVNQQIRRLPGTEREYINIQRDFQLNDNIYTFLLQKRSEAGIALASNVSDHKIIDPAMVRHSRQTSPRPFVNLFVAGILGLIFPAIGLIIGDSLNTRVNSQFSIEEHTAIPVLGNIEHDRTNKKMPVIEHPRSPLAESFRALRTNIDFILGKNQLPPVIASTSTVAGEGKSFCSANLGAIMSITGKKVLVVGMDLRKPRTHTEFNIDNSKGLSNYLRGTASFSETIVLSAVPGLSVIPSGPIPPNPAELLQSDKMTSFLNDARQQFDVIILDTPPLALVSDTLLITGMTDLNLFIIRQGHSRKQAINFINHLEESGRIGKTGIVVNDVKIQGSYSPANKYGYGYGYERFRKSGYYE